MSEIQHTSLTAQQLELLRYFNSDAAKACKTMEELLCNFYFRQEDGRALIIQSKDHYCVLFLSPDIFNDEDRKREEVERFFELMSLVRWLKEQGYISLYRGVGTYGKLMHFLQDDFVHVQPHNGKMVLNTRGDYTASPDTIHDKNGTVVYRGIVFDNDYFQMIANAVSGRLYLFSGIADAEEPPPPGVTDEPAATEPATQPEKKNTTPVFMVAAGLLVLLSLLSVIFSFCSLRDANRTRAMVASGFTRVMHHHDSIAKTHRGNALYQGGDDSGAYFGIDISHWDGNIMRDIHAVDSLAFVICKATEGMSGIDPDFTKNWGLVKSKKLIRGAYHFYRTEDDALAQAAHFYQVVSMAGIDSMDMPLIVDIEELSLAKDQAPQKERIQQALFDFMQQVEKLSGRIPWLYTDHNFASIYLDQGRFARYPLWLADYAKAPRVPKTWEAMGYRIWQRSDTVRVSSHAVDYDIYYGRRAGLYRNGGR